MEKEAPKPLQKLDKLEKYKMFFQSEENTKPRNGSKKPKSQSNETGGSKTDRTKSNSNDSIINKNNNKDNKISSSSSTSRTKDNKNNNNRYSSGFHSASELSDELDIQDSKDLNDVFEGIDDTDMSCNHNEVDKGQSDSLHRSDEQPYSFSNLQNIDDYLGDKKYNGYTTDKKSSVSDDCGIEEGDDNVFDHSNDNHEQNDHQGYSSDDSQEGFQLKDKAGDAPVHPNRKKTRKIQESVKQKASRYDSIEAFKTLGSLQPELDICGNKGGNSSTASANPYISVMKTVGASKENEEEVANNADVTEEPSSLDHDEKQEKGTWKEVGWIRQVVNCIENFDAEQGRILEVLLWGPLLFMMLYIIFVESGNLIIGSLTESDSK